MVRAVKYERQSLLLKNLTVKRFGARALEAMGELETKTQIAVQVVLPQVATQPEAWGDALIIAQTEEQ